MLKFVIRENESVNILERVDKDIHKKYFYEIIFSLNRLVEQVSECKSNKNLIRSLAIILNVPNFYELINSIKYEYIIRTECKCERCKTST